MPQPHHLTLQLLMTEIQILTSHIWAIAPTAVGLWSFLKKIHIYTPILHTCVVKTTDTYDTKKLLLSVALLFVAKMNYQWCKRGFVNIS